MRSLVEYIRSKVAQRSSTISFCSSVSSRPAVSLASFSSTFCLLVNCCSTLRYSYWRSRITLSSTACLCRYLWIYGPKVRSDIFFTALYLSPLSFFSNGVPVKPMSIISLPIIARMASCKRPLWVR